MYYYMTEGKSLTERMDDYKSKGKTILNKIGEYIYENPMKSTLTLTAAIIVGGVLYKTQTGRGTINPNGATIERQLPNDYNRMINVSAGGTEGDMMVTYENKNGLVITKEYNRGGLFETTVKWKMPEEKKK